MPGAQLAAAAPPNPQERVLPWACGLSIPLGSARLVHAWRDARQMQAERPAVPWVPRYTPSSPNTPELTQLYFLLPPSWTFQMKK